MKFKRLIALLCSIALAAACTPTTDDGAGDSTAGLRRDHLGSALRAEVEALKAAVAEQPTDERTIATRARVLADWVDGHAMAKSDGSLLAPRVRRYATVPPRGESAIAQGRIVDALVKEYTLRDEEPEALGDLRAETLGPFEARSFATLRQIWTVGSRGIKTGGGFWLARHFSTNFGMYQTEDPGATGYVTIESTDPDAVFNVETVMASGPHGGFRAPEPALAFIVSEGGLDPGETVTLTYGNTSGGGTGLLMPTIAGESVPLPVYVDLEGTREWVQLPILPFVIEGTRTTGVHGFAPSIVTPGETFELSVRAEDEYFNRATGPIPAFEVLVDGEVKATTPAGNVAINVVELSLDELGPHWITLRSADGAIQGEANPILVEEDPAYRIYWGDTHGHSGYAEGIGTIDYFMRFARDDARLDFVTHSEHDTALDEAEWQLMIRTNAAYDDPGRFIPYLGYEWTMVARNGGHHNVLFRSIQNQERVSALEYPTLSSLYQGLRRRYEPSEVLVIPHAHNPGDARQSDPLLEPLIEVMSMHGTFEWFMRNYLSNGHQVGFVAASDDHMAHPGYSAPSRDTLAQRGGLGGVFAPQRSRDAIFDAMKAHRTYATTGDRIILDVQLNGALMGQRAVYAKTRNIKGRVIGTAPIDSITLYKNDEPIWNRQYLIDEAARLETEMIVRLSFRSDSTPLHWGDAPRGWRHWRGSLMVEDASLKAATPTDFVNPKTQYLEHEGNTVEFATITRGDESSIELHLTGIGARAEIVLRLEETRETGSAPPFYRRHATIRASEIRLALRDMVRGRLERESSIDDYADSVILRRVIRHGAREVAFEYSDSVAPRQGDYYYVRVRQANDATAWSSPIWVGGYPSR